MDRMQHLALKKETLLQIAFVRDKVCSYAFIHVFINDKFTRSIVEFINAHFDPSEHCFVFCGGRPEEQFPLPEGDNIFICDNPACLAVSDAVSKVIFHGLFNWDIIVFLYEHPEFLEKSYWVVWGGDLHDAPSTLVDDYVRSHFQGIATNAHSRKVYQQRYGKEKAFFPLGICFESIEYERIVATPVPQKKYVQIQVNNSTHPSTLEVLHSLEKFKDENIIVTTVLSYGRQTWQKKILGEGKDIFGHKFYPVMEYIPKDKYIKLLARNDIFILNQKRPQGMTTAFTSMILGKKVFMHGNISDFLHEEGYTLHDTRSLGTLSFEQLCANPAADENKRLAAGRFDPVIQKERWRNIFDYAPPTIPDQDTRPGVSRLNAADCAFVTS